VAILVGVVLCVVILALVAAVIVAIVLYDRQLAAARHALAVEQARHAQERRALYRYSFVEAPGQVVALAHADQLDADLDAMVRDAQEMVQYLDPTGGFTAGTDPHTREPMQPVGLG
jgi:hypothetical protein